MTAVKQFIEDAEKGGWDKRLVTDEFDGRFNVEAMLLDPLAWQAVGKTRGWNVTIKWSNIRRANESVVGSSGYEKGDMIGRSINVKIWTDKWHNFIDQLANGKTIEEALVAIS